MNPTLTEPGAARSAFDQTGLSSRYELLEEVGRGGMGVVYRGKHRVLGQIVAVKFHTLSAGIDRFQLKVGNEPGTDVARTRACVEAGGLSTVVVADANGGWDLASARVAIHGMRDLGVFVEQPCRSTADSAAAHRGSPLPLVLDESVSTLADLVAARHEAGAVSVNLKISRVGGLTRGNVTLKTGFGQIGIGVQDGTAARLDVHTQFGKFRNELQASDQPGPADQTVEVYARTSYGDITVHRS